MPASLRVESACRHDFQWILRTVSTLIMCKICATPCQCSCFLRSIGLHLLHTFLLELCDQNSQPERSPRLGFKHHQNSTRKTKREEKLRIVAGEGKKSAKFPPFWAPPSGAPLSSQNSTLAEIEICRSRNWPKSKMAEVELAELAEVDHPQP